MRLRAVRYFLGVIILLVFGFVYCPPAYADVGQYDVRELYNSGDKFTQFVNTDGDDFRIVYVTSVETGELHVQVLKNGDVTLNYNFPCGSVGFNKSYFYVDSVFYDQGKLYGRVFMRLHQNGTWWNLVNLTIITDGYEGQITYPPTEEQTYKDFIKGKLIIYLPVADPYTTNKNYASVWFNYALPHIDGEIPSLSFTGGNWSKESGKTWVKDGYIYGKFNYEVFVDMGENYLSVSADYDDEVYSDTRTVIRTGFIDEDGDGYDDNTGEGWWPSPGETDMGDGVPQPPGEDATIFDYIKYLSDSLVYSMNQMLVMLRSFMGGLAQLGEVFRGFFSFMPPQFSAIILLGLIMAVILRVVSR